MDPSEVSDELYSTLYSMRVTGDDVEYRIDGEERRNDDLDYQKPIAERVKEVDQALREETTFVMGGYVLGDEWLSESPAMSSRPVNFYTEEDLDRRINLFDVREIEDPEIDGYIVGDDKFTFLVQEGGRYEETVPVKFEEYTPDNVRLRIPTQEAFEKEVVRQLEKMSEEIEDHVETDRELIDMINLTDRKLEDTLEEMEENNEVNIRTEKEDDEDDRDMEFDTGR